MTAPRIVTPLTRLTGVTHPIIQTAMGWVSGASLVSATAEAGALGFLASATMSLNELERAIVRVRERTDKPFGVNLRADASDAPARIALIRKYEVPVAGFALAPKRDYIDELKDAGVVVIPSIGAVRHAEKLQSWGVDAVMVQGNEGGGHTGKVPTNLLIPQVVSTVDIPVVAAGGFYSGRGLAAALAFGAVGIGMGTRFLLTRDSRVPDAIKQRYLDAHLDGTVVTTKADGVPHRVLHTEFIEQLEHTGGARRMLASARRALEYRRLSGASWAEFLREGLQMKRSTGRSYAQLAQAANTPMLLRAGLVEGDLSAGMLASGQVVGLIDDLPTCAELIARIMTEAVERIHAMATVLIDEASTTTGDTASAAE